MGDLADKLEALYENARIPWRDIPTDSPLAIQKADAQTRIHFLCRENLPKIIDALRARHTPPADADWVEVVKHAIKPIRMWDGDTLDMNLTREEITAVAQAAISALAPLMAGEGWQAIETAPRDGSPILLVDMRAQAPEVGMGWYIAGQWSGDDPEVLRGDNDCTSCWPAPTHWRPLPPLPAIQSAEHLNRDGTDLLAVIASNPNSEPPFPNPATSEVGNALADRVGTSATPPAKPVAQWRRVGTGPWYDGYPDNQDGGGPYETRTLYAHPAPPAVDDGLVKRLRACVNSAPSNKTVTLTWDFADKILQILEALPRSEG